MSARGTVTVAARIALLGIFVAIFATMSRPHDVAVPGVKSARDPFSFDF